MSHTVDLYLRGYKGLRVLKAVCAESIFAKRVGAVFTDGEENAEKDYQQEIRALARESGLRVGDFRELDTAAGLTSLESPWALAVGWRFLLRRSSLLVLHDSLLPKYRGFNPLVSMLINGEERIGASLIIAASEVDAGDIVAQKDVRIAYPISLEEAMSRIGDLYETLTSALFTKVVKDEELSGKPQDHSQATYSLWRDEMDYEIDWSRSAAEIRRFVDAVGFPYLGAFSTMGEKRVRVLKAQEMPDIKIENRSLGKVFRLDEGRPVVVCGSGLLRIDAMNDDASKKALLPFKSLRQRFGTSRA